jgi:hypothetical protein
MRSRTATDVQASVIVAIAAVAQVAPPTRLVTFLLAFTTGCARIVVTRVMVARVKIQGSALL